MSSDQDNTAPSDSAQPAASNGQAPAGATMAPPLFYQEPVPVTANGHGKFKIRGSANFNFARETNAVPVTLPEFVLAARHYPIVFVGTELVPTVALGFRPDQNLYVQEDGSWERFAYIPAYVRRFPFILLGRQDDERLQLGVCNKASSDRDDARALFEGEKETQVVTDALDLCQQFHGAYQQTAEFSEMLKTSDLVIERSLEVDMGNGEKMDVGAFAAINEEKLREASDEQFLEWRKKGWLAAMYFHIASLNNWEQIIGRLPEAQSPPKS